MHNAQQKSDLHGAVNNNVTVVVKIRIEVHTIITPIFCMIFCNSLMFESQKCDHYQKPLNTIVSHSVIFVPP